MRGEHCVAGASILSAIAVILLVFAHIGQVAPGTLTKSLYLAEINVQGYADASWQAFGTNFFTVFKKDNTDDLGKNAGLRSNYRYGLYKSCAYLPDGNGVCNSTRIVTPMEAPYSVLMSDLVPARQGNLASVIPTSAASFKDNGLNRGLSRTGSWLIFAGSCLVFLSLIFGFIRARIFFLVAAATGGIGALFLLIGAALWTALINKNDWGVKAITVKNATPLGIRVSAGPSLYLTWAAFGVATLSVLPYVIACCTFRRN